MNRLKHFILCGLNIHEWDGFYHSISDVYNRKNLNCKYCHKKIRYDVVDACWIKDLGGDE